MSNVTTFKDIVLDGNTFTIQYDELHRGHRLIVQAYGDDLISPWREMTAEEITLKIAQRINNIPLFDLNVDLEKSRLDLYELANNVKMGSNDYIWEILAPMPVNESIVATVQQIMRDARLGFKVPNIYVETFSSKYAPEISRGKELLPTLKEHIISFYGDRNILLKNIHTKELLTILKQKLNNNVLENNFKNTGVIKEFNLGHVKDLSGNISLTDNFSIKMYSDKIDDIAGTADEMLEKIQDFIVDLNFSTFHTIWLKTGSALQGEKQLIY